MSFYRPSYKGVDLQKEPAPVKPRRSAGGIIFGIVAIIIIIAVVILVIVWLAVRSRNLANAANAANMDSANNCTTVLAAPRNVLTVYNQNNNTATLSWQQVAGATRYRIYRKLEDPAVNSQNSEEQINTINNSYNFIDLPVGTHYFVVTAFSSCGLESMISMPAVFSPSCDNPLAAIDLSMVPNIVLLNDQCGALNPVALASVDFPVDPVFQNGIVIFNGAGQEGSVKSHLSIIDVSPLAGIQVNASLECSGLDTEHYFSYITNVQNVPLTAETMTLAADLTSTLFTVNWSPIAGAEMYAVSMVTENPTTNIVHTFGGYATAPQTSLALATNPGEAILEIKVRAFRVCDRSPLSEPFNFTTPVIPP